jgi:hypothetical protein
MPAPILAVLGTFLSGALAASGASVRPGRTITITDALGNRTRYRDGKEQFRSSEEALAVWLGGAGRQYNRLERAARTAQQLQAKTTLLGLELRDEVLTNKISSLTAAKGGGPDYTGPAVAVALLLGAWLLLR